MQNQGNIFDFLKEKYYLCIRFNQTIQIIAKTLASPDVHTNIWRG